MPCSYPAATVARTAFFSGTPFSCCAAQLPLPVCSQCFYILHRHPGTPFEVLWELASKLCLVGPWFHQVIANLSKPATVLSVLLSKASEAFFSVPVKPHVKPQAKLTPTGQNGVWVCHIQSKALINFSPCLSLPHCLKGLHGIEEWIHHDWRWRRCAVRWRIGDDDATIKLTSTYSVSSSTSSSTSSFTSSLAAAAPASRAAASASAAAASGWIPWLRSTRAAAAAASESSAAASTSSTAATAAAVSASSATASGFYPFLVA